MFAPKNSSPKSSPSRPLAQKRHQLGSSKSSPQSSSRPWRESPSGENSAISSTVSSTLMNQGGSVGVKLSSAWHAEEASDTVLVAKDLLGSHVTSRSARPLKHKTGFVKSATGVIVAKGNRKSSSSGRETPNQFSSKPTTLADDQHRGSNKQERTQVAIKDWSKGKSQLPTLIFSNGSAHSAVPHSRTNGSLHVDGADLLGGRTDSEDWRSGSAVTFFQPRLAGDGGNLKVDVAPQRAASWAGSSLTGNVSLQAGATKGSVFGSSLWTEVGGAFGTSAVGWGDVGRLAEAKATQQLEQLGNLAGEPIGEEVFPTENGGNTDRPAASELRFRYGEATVQENVPHQQPQALYEEHTGAAIEHQERAQTSLNSEGSRSRSGGRRRWDDSPSSILEAESSHQGSMELLEAKRRELRALIEGASQNLESALDQHPKGSAPPRLGLSDSSSPWLEETLGQLGKFWPGGYGQAGSGISGLSNGHESAADRMGAAEGSKQPSTADWHSQAQGGTLQTGELEEEELEEGKVEEVERMKANMKHVLQDYQLSQSQASHSNLTSIAMPSQALALKADEVRARSAQPPFWPAGTQGLPPRGNISIGSGTDGQGQQAVAEQQQTRRNVVESLHDESSVGSVQTLQAGLMKATQGATSCVTNSGPAGSEGSDAGSSWYGTGNQASMAPFTHTRAGLPGNNASASQAGATVFNQLLLASSASAPSLLGSTVNAGLETSVLTNGDATAGRSATLQPIEEETTGSHSMEASSASGQEGNNGSKKGDEASLGSWLRKEFEGMGQSWTGPQREENDVRQDEGFGTRNFALAKEERTEGGEGQPANLEMEPSAKGNSSGHEEKKVIGQESMEAVRSISWQTAIQPLSEHHAASSGGFLPHPVRTASGEALLMEDELRRLNEKRERMFREKLQASIINGDEGVPEWAKGWKSWQEESVKTVPKWNRTKEGWVMEMDVEVSEFMRAQKESKERAEARARLAEEQAKMARGEAARVWETEKRAREMEVKAREAEAKLQALQAEAWAQKGKDKERESTTRGGMRRLGSGKSIRLNSIAAEEQDSDSDQFQPTRETQSLSKGPRAAERSRMSGLGGRQVARALNPSFTRAESGGGQELAGDGVLDEGARRKQSKLKSFVTTHTSGLYEEDDAGSGGLEENPDAWEEKGWEVVQADRVSSVEESGAELGTWSGRDDWSEGERKMGGRRKGLGRWGRGWVRQAARGAEGDDILRRMKEVEEVAKRNRDEEWKEELSKLVAEDNELRSANRQLQADLEQVLEDKRKLEVFAREAMSRTMVNTSVTREREDAGLLRLSFPASRYGGRELNGDRLMEGRSLRGESREIGGALSADGTMEARSLLKAGEGGQEELVRRMWELEMERDTFAAKAEEVDRERVSLAQRLQQTEDQLKNADAGAEEKLRWYESRLRQALAEAEAQHAAYTVMERRVAEEASAAESLRERMAVESEARARSKKERDEARLREEKEREKRIEAERKVGETEVEVGRVREEGEERVKAAEVWLVSAQKEVQKLERQVNDLRQQVTDGETREGQLRGEVELREKLLGRAREEVAAASRDMEEIGRLRRTAEALATEKEKMEGLLEKVRKELQRVREEIRVKEGEVDHGKILVTQLQTQLKEEVGRRENAEGLLGDVKVKVSWLEDKVREKGEEAARGRMEMEELVERIEAEEEGRGRAERELEEGRRREAEAREEMKAWEEKVGVLETRLREQERIKGELEGKVVEKEGELGNLKARLVEKEVSGKAMTDRLQEKERELKTAKEDMQKLLNDIMASKEERAKLGAEVQGLRLAKEEAGLKCKALEEEIQKLDTKLQVLEIKRERWEERAEEEMQKAREIQEESQREVEETTELRRNLLEEMQLLKDQNEHLERMTYEQSGEIEILREHMKQRGLDLDEEYLLRP